MQILLPSIVDKVLILAREEVVAALLGLMVETHGLDPRFPSRGEPVGDALRRDRFRKVLIDCDYPDCNEELVEAVRTAGAQPIFFSPLGMSSQQRDVASRFGANTFTLPADPHEFGKILLQS
jgi:DNA-binding response OmpR family regulator